MQNGRFNFDTTMNFHPPHQHIGRFPSQIPPIYGTHGFQPPNSSEFHQPPINPPPLPYGYGGCPDYEQRLRDEVIYLHSLWRRGPPQIQTQNPHLKPLPTTPFKKKKKKKKSNKPQIVSDKEWPVDPKALCPSPPKQGWGEFKPRTSPSSRPAPAEERERVLAVRVQLKGLDSCIGFFHGSDDEDAVDDDDEEEEYDEEEAFEFFVQLLFEEDEKLRDYYKTNCEHGEFYCLVCGVIGLKLGRKYKDCVALVQHSVSISKTKRKVAHRAYGRAVCKVLGWDIGQLPALPSTLMDAIVVKEWPVNPKAACPSPPRQGWGEFKPRPSPNSCLAPVEEQERVLAVRVQLKGLDSCIGLFHKSDDEDEGDDEEEDYDEEEAFEFFFKVFEEDEKLREYYKIKCANGEFYCLVCGVIGNKLGRKYKDCVALVQHSVTISKTKKKIAHRAYGRVVCKVLGWDIDRLPSLPSSLVDANAVFETQSLEKSGEPPLPQDNLPSQ